MSQVHRRGIVYEAPDTNCWPHTRFGSYARLWTGVRVNLSISWEGELFPGENQVLLKAEREMDRGQEKTTEEYSNFLIIDSHNSKHDNLVKG